MSQRNKARRIVYVLFGILLLLTAPILIDSPGKFLPILFICIAAIFLCLFAPKHLEEKWVFFPWVPGYRLLAKDMEIAQRSPAGDEATKLGYVILLLAVSSGGLLSGNALLSRLGFLQPDWAAWWPKGASFIVIYHKFLLWIIVLVPGCLVYIAFTSLLNWIVHLAFVASRQADFADSLQDLLCYFGVSEQAAARTNMPHSNRYWLTFSRHMKNIYGHKIWASTRMTEMCRKLQNSREKLGAAQWFLLEFAADIMDTHVGDNSERITHTYETAQEYSSFLGQTISYTSKNIVWITDHRDLNKYLLPYAIDETCLSYVQKYGSTLTNGDDKERSCLLDRLYGYYINSTQTTKRASILGEAFCQVCKHNLKCLTPNGRVCILPLDLSGWQSVVKDISTWARRVTLASIESAAQNGICQEIDVGEIWERCKERKTDIILFPHMKAYHDLGVPKSRIFDLPAIGGMTQNYELGNKGAEFVADRLIAVLEGKNTMDNVRSNKKRLERIASATMQSQKPESIVLICAAMRLFSEQCRADVVGFGEISPRITNEDNCLLTVDSKGGRAKYYDIGLYDEVVYVNSSPVSKDKHREVRWGLLPDADGLRTVLLDYKPCRNIGAGKQQPCVANKRVYPLREFAEKLNDWAKDEGIVN